MKDRSHSYPDDQSLAAGLTSALASTGSAPVTVIRRLPNPLASTFASEVVTCRLGDRDPLTLLCKYGGRDHPAYGHRGGVGYEAEVYSRVLAAANGPVPCFYGAASAGPAGEVWLAIGYLKGARCLNDIRDRKVWEHAAAWAGHFHAEHEACDQPRGMSFLISYDASYFSGWAQRTAENAAAMYPDLAWVGELCRRAGPALLGLLESPRTVIHGEYYPRNILVNDGIIYPVDWESAAFARGEIDLATLTDRCDPDTVLHCDAAYRFARWPQGAPSDFTRVLDLARLYVNLRWLGAEPGPKSRRRFWRYEEVRALGERLGLI